MTQRHARSLAALALAGLAACGGVQQSGAPGPDEGPGPFAVGHYNALASNGGIVSATASSYQPNNPPADAIDGDFSTRWQAYGAGSWIAVDLGSVQTISGVQIAWYRGALRQYFFSIAASSDGVNYANVYSGTSSGTTFQFELYTFPSTSARYVKITVNGNTKNNWASITEIAVTTASITTTPPPSTAIAVAVTPQNPSVAAGGTAQFTASVTGATDTSVTWSVLEGTSGGAVDSTGLYTAPATAGTYHVVAQSNADPTQTGRSAVTVTAPTTTTSGTTSTGSTTTSGTTTTTSAGPQFYVSTAGNDSNPGTLSQPWRTIQKAMNSATAGSTVNIMAGTYTERLSVNVSGSAGNYITFQPNGFTGPGTGDSVVLDYTSRGTVTDGVPYLGIGNQSYVRIQGLTFQNYQVLGAMQRGVWIHGSSSFIEMKYNKHLYIQNNGAWDGTNALLNYYIDGPANNIWVYSSELGYIVSNMSEAITTYGSTAVTIENNYIHDTDGIGIDHNVSSSGAVIRGNVLEWVSKKHDGTYWYNSAAAAIYVTGGNTATIERNTVRDSGWAYEICSEPGYPAAHDVIVRNNLAYRNANGVMVGNWYSDTDGSNVYNVKVLNNTLYQNDGGFRIRPYTSSTVVWENNILANNSASVVNTLGWPVGTMNYNLYYGGGTGPDANMVSADPQFTNAGAGDFSLQATSPAINAGDPSASTNDVGTADFAGNTRIVGGRVDIGAYEAQ